MTTIKMEILSLVKLVFSPHPFLNVKKHLNQGFLNLFSIAMIQFGYFLHQVYSP